MFHVKQLAPTLYQKRGDGMRSEQLAAIITLLAIYHPAGCNILLGIDKELSPDEWRSLVEAITPSGEPVHVRSDKDPCAKVLSMVDRDSRIPDVIHRLGGWERVVYAANRLKSEKPTHWRGVRDYCEIQTAPVKFYSVEELADRLHVNPATLWKWKTQVPQIIAHLAVTWDGQTTLAI